MICALFPGCNSEGCQEMVTGKNILHSQGKVREFYFESGVIDVLKKSQTILTEFKTGDLIPLKTGREIWGDCDLNDAFPS